MHYIAQIIEAANFDEHDQDAATNGLCGSFALALNAVVPQSKLMLLCFADSSGSVLLDRDGIPFWRHVLVSVDDRLFDIDGEVQLQDIIENYCWNNPLKAGGSIISVSNEELLRALDDGGRSYDPDYIRKWTQALVAAKTSIRIEDTLAETSFRYAP